MQVFGRVSVLDRGGNGGGRRDCEVQYLKLGSFIILTAYIFGRLNTVYIL